VRSVRQRREVALVACLLTIGSAALRSQDAVPRLDSASTTLESLLHTRGPPWVPHQSPHFRIFAERPMREGELARVADSLEGAWRHARSLLEYSINDDPRATVLVTRSRTRFAGLVPKQGKGLYTQLRADGGVIVLVRNDSVRAYSRHEVMHLVAFSGWGSPRGGWWLAEGLATFADGTCQHTTIAAVGRDRLRAQPSLTATALQRRFLELWRADRAMAYVLAGTLVDYLWATRGREGVRRLWQGGDSLDEQSVLPGAGGELTRGWRAHVERSAGNASGIDSTSFRRAGCG
jgi:hypothetical protein